MRLFAILTKIIEKILEIITSLNGKPEIVLLWTNSAPSNSFAGQSMTFDDRYDLVVILGAYNTSYTQLTCTSIIPAIAPSVAGVINGFWQFGVVRSVNVDFGATDKTTVAFGSGQIYNTYAGAVTTSNAYCIPRAIYGIKNVAG